MKRRILIIALALAAVTAAIGTTVASLLPVATDVYVRIDNASTPVKFAGTFNITPGSQPVTINILDTRPNPDVVVQRQARDAAGNLILASTAVSFNSTETLP